MKQLLTLTALMCSVLLFAQQETAQYNDINDQLNPSDGTAAVAPTPNVSGELLLPEEITVGQKNYMATMQKSSEEECMFY